jgi:SAM-dependent methyltransferase
VVCAFQVVEHATDPLAFVRQLVSALRPGGRLLVGVPAWPTPMTAIPNLVINGPPHHLTLWNRRALETLAAQLGLVVSAIDPVPVGKDFGLLYWMGRATPKFGSKRLFRHAWSWHLGLVWAYCAAHLLDRIRKPPKDAEPMLLLLVADKPA